MKSERERKLKKSRKKRRISTSRLIMFGVLLIIVLLFAVSVRNVWTLRAEQKELKRENKQLTVQKAKLQKELKNVNDKNYIEKQARQQLKLIKPGETLFIIEDEQDSGNNAGSGK
ncbi:MAG: septum formation initiator family protein [Eubacteriales bacterium]|nr:septum formation initiator family protein [Eubacteriales bacterium]